MNRTPAIDRTLFLTREQASHVRERWGTPCYVYDERALEEAAKQALSFPVPNLTVRYAMKANSSRGILEVFRRLGLHIDASSDFEVKRAIRAGFAPSTIQLTSQKPSQSLQEFLALGVSFNACSLYQLERFGELAPGQKLSVRINSGLASESPTNKTNTGGPASSFGIWRDYLDRVKELARTYRLRITSLHSHIGSGAKTAQWMKAVELTLQVAAELEDVDCVNLGGGFKIGRMPAATAASEILGGQSVQRVVHRRLWEPTIDLHDLGHYVAERLDEFRERHGRSLRLEIEPGTFLVARAGAIVATCVDVVDTGVAGYLFAKLDAGMNEILRPSLYGAQHPIDVLKATPAETVETVFVGPCCESGDILTTEPQKSEELLGRFVPKPVIGDLVVIGGAGAYCASMATINYNSYPQAPEVMLHRDGSLRLLRQRQSPESVWANEDAAENEPLIPSTPHEAPSQIPIKRPTL